MGDQPLSSVSDASSILHFQGEGVPQKRQTGRPKKIQNQQRKTNAESPVQDTESIMSLTDDVPLITDFQEEGTLKKRKKGMGEKAQGS